MVDLPFAKEHRAHMQTEERLPFPPQFQGILERAAALDSIPIFHRADAAQNLFMDLLELTYQIAMRVERLEAARDHHGNALEAAASGMSEIRERLDRLERITSPRRLGE
jgi:hypothetical protein